MGIEISTNFSSVEPIFSLDLWKVSRAVHKASGRPVSIWSLDSESLQHRFPKKADRDAYFDLSMHSIQEMRKLNHPNILRVYNFVERKPELAFAAEPVAFCAGDLTSKLHPLEAAYISNQLAETIAFLHQQALIIHMGISPLAVVLTESLTLKLCHFQWSIGLPSPDQKTISERIIKRGVQSELQYKAPEVLEKRQVTPKADVFALGLVMYNVFTGQDLNTAKTPEDILAAWPTRVCTQFDVPEEFKGIIQRCLTVDPMGRADIMEVTESEAFETMQLKSLRYLDSLETKDADDKVTFFKGLSRNVKEFSRLLQRKKILPALLEQCSENPAFVGMLLGAVLEIGADMDPDMFLAEVWEKLQGMTTIVNPPEVSIAFLAHIQFIMEKIDKSRHSELVYPIIMAALESTEARIHKECLERMPVILDCLKVDHVRWLLLPKLADLLNRSDCVNFPLVIQCMALTLKVVDHDGFAVECLPKVYSAWQKHKNPQVGDAIIRLLGKLNAQLDTMLSSAVPIASSILGSRVLDPRIGEMCCDWIIGLMQNFKTTKLAEPGIKEFNSMMNMGKFRLDPGNIAGQVSLVDFGMIKSTSASALLGGQNLGMLSQVGQRTAWDTDTDSGFVDLVPQVAPSCSHQTLPGRLGVGKDQRIAAVASTGNLGLAGISPPVNFEQSWQWTDQASGSSMQTPEQQSSSRSEFFAESHRRHSDFPMSAQQGEL